MAVSLSNQGFPGAGRAGAGSLSEDEAPHGPMTKLSTPEMSATLEGEDESITA